MAPPKKKTQSKPPATDESLALDPMKLSTPALDSRTLRMSYRIARGEQGVLSFEPYKSILLPYWRFKTVPIAETSSVNLKAAFDHYVKAEDLVRSQKCVKPDQQSMCAHEFNACADCDGYVFRWEQTCPANSSKWA